MALDYVPGVGMVDRATGKPMFSAPGAAPTDQEAASASYFKRKKEFEDETHWRADREYDWKGLYGSVDPSGSYTPSFGVGMNDSWGGALGDRLINRERGMLDGLGHFESKLGTSAEDYQRRIYARNNAIEEMFRRGYSRNQIGDYLAGNVDKNNFQPDWSDYRKMKRKSMGASKGQDAAGLLSGAIQLEKQDDAFWGDDYFIGAPESAYAENPFGNQAANTKPQGGTFTEAYKKRREELDSKRSVMSLFKEMEDYQGE